MALKKSVHEIAQYNTEMYMARLVLKSPAVHLSAVIVSIYAICRAVLSISVMIAGGDFINAILSATGILLIAVGFVCSLCFSRNGGGTLITSLTVAMIGTLVSVAATIEEIVLVKFDAEVACQLLLTIFAIFVCSAVTTAAKGEEASVVSGYLFGFSALATLVFSAIALASVASALRGCFAASYNWGFLHEDVDVNTTQIKWYFLKSNINGTAIETVFFARFAERISFLLMLLTMSVTALRTVPYINSERRIVEFAQDAGDYSTYDGADFRTISKRRASENVKNQAYYGVSSFDKSEASFDERVMDHNPKYKTNEYGDYLDEETGIYYYFDSRIGKYYYLDKQSGEYVYKQEQRSKAPLNSADAMPWELSDEMDEEDNIYNY